MKSRKKNSEVMFDFFKFVHDNVVSRYLAKCQKYNGKRYVAHLFSEIGRQ